jgi:hypothetical protein
MKGNVAAGDEHVVRQEQRIAFIAFAGAIVINLIAWM